MGEEGVGKTGATAHRWARGSRLSHAVTGMKHVTEAVCRSRDSSSSLSRSLSLSLARPAHYRPLSAADETTDQWLQAKTRGATKKKIRNKQHETNKTQQNEKKKNI